ncbi:MAG: GGDEF domain-containing protein [Planctomycetota bacterium]
MKAQLVDANQDHYDARHDELTGLLNRRGWNEVVRRTLNSMAAQRTSEDHSVSPLSLAIFDLDQFKQINDQYGHGVGDQVLVMFSQRLQSAFANPIQECVARLGGEEFAVLSGQAPEALGRDAERFIEGLQAVRTAIANVDIIIRCSVGITQYAHGEEPATWMDRADKALYESKQNGGNQIRCIYPTI